MSRFQPTDGRRGPFPARPPLIDRIRSRMRLKHLSPRTEQAYVHWIRRYVSFHGRRHPAELGEEHIEALTGWASP